MKSRAWFALAGLLLLPIVLWTMRPLLSRVPAESKPQPMASEPKASAIGCIGRFTTEAPVVRIAAPYFESRPSVIARLLVNEGDWVKAGQALAWLDGKRQTEAEHARALKELDLAERRVTQAQAGAKRGEISAQSSEISRLEAALRLAQTEFHRDEQLYAAHDISLAQFDRSRSTLETSTQSVKEAQHRLTALSEFRPEDLQVAQGELTVSRARIAEIEARLAGTVVVAPVAGRVIKIHAHAGEKAEQDGILELADTTHMAVEAEVYAADIQSVHAGQHASIEVEAENGVKLTGEVVSIGARVRKPAVLPNDPVAYSDAHVVPVRIRVDGCKEGSCPIDGRVKVVIETRP